MANFQDSNGNDLYSVLKDKIGAGFKNKKILLTTLDSAFLDNQYVFPYLGVLYLASVAAEIGMKVRFIDRKENQLTPKTLSEFNFFYTDEFDLNNIELYRDIDVIAISCMTPQGIEAYQICREVKRKYPEKIIILGGPHAEYYFEECLSNKFDMIIVGDGERVFKELLLGDADSLFEKLSRKSKLGTLVFSDYLSVKEMNSYPIPYREKAYISKYNYFLNRVKATTLVNSRGCPMGCAFCEDRRTHGRWFSPEHFEREIQDIVGLGIKAIMIFDDLFAINPKKMKPYSDILKKYHKKVSLIYRCFGHAKVIANHPEILDLLSESGCVEIGFGAEGASQEILDTVYKGTKIEQMHACIERTIQAGIKVKAFFMIGLPGETEQTFQETYTFIKKYRSRFSDFFDFDFAVFFPYKGTLIGDIMRLPKGKTIIFKNQKIDRTFFKIRLKRGLNWADIDSQSYGAYKKRGGDSDIVVETYDWEKNKILLSSEQINELKESVMLLSGRYTGHKGDRIFIPMSEGNVGSAIS